MTDWTPIAKGMPSIDKVVEVYLHPSELRHSNHRFAKLKKFLRSGMTIWMPYPCGAQLVGVTHWRYPEPPLPD